MDEHATALAQAIEDVLPGWVERSVASVLAASGLEPDDGLQAEAEVLGTRAAAEIGDAVRRLLSLDIDEQRSTPLTLLRGAVVYPTGILRRAGVPPVATRDDVRVRLFPDDIYDLSPASFADVDPRLTEPGLVWGASKAFEHLRRHQPPPAEHKDDRPREPPHHRLRSRPHGPLQGGRRRRRHLCGPPCGSGRHRRRPGGGRPHAAGSPRGPRRRGAEGHRLRPPHRTGPYGGGPGRGLRRGRCPDRRSSPGSTSCWPPTEAPSPIRPPVFVAYGSPGDPNATRTGAANVSGGRRGAASRRR